MSNKTSSFDVDALIRMPVVSLGDVSPDGQQIAFSSNETGRSQLYLLSLEDGAKPQQITFDDERKVGPRWSHDSRYLAFNRDFQGDENYHIFIYDTSNGATSQLTNLTDTAIYPGVSWSPDDQHIAFVSNQEGIFAAYVVSVNGGEIRRISHHEYSDGTVEWSPDGRWIAFDANVDGLNNGLFVVPAEGGEIRELRVEGKLLDASEPVWSPDNQHLAFVSSARGSQHLAIWNLHDDSVKWLTEGDTDADYARWSPDGTKLAYVINREADGIIAVQTDPLAETLSQPKYYQVEPGFHTTLRWTPDSDGLIFNYTGPRNPNDIFTSSLTSGPIRQLTNSLPPHLSNEIFVEPSHITYLSADGTLIPALIYRGASAGPQAAAIIDIHGGPTAQAMKVWSLRVQYMVSQGYSVLCPNYRGSTGYGKAFKESNRFNLGVLDLADVVAGAEFLVREGIAAENKIAVTGGSWGGYLTMMAITKYPQKWAAAVSIVPFLNWFTEYENEREDLQYYDRQMMGDPVEHYQRWYDASPINFLENITTPVLLLAGAHDPRCPAEETEQAIDKLRELGKTFDAHIYPDEGHGFARIENRLDAIKREVAYIVQHNPSK